MSDIQANRRIDAGIKRGKRPAQSKPKDAETGQFLPICSAEQREVIVSDALKRLKSGEYTDQIAESHNIRPRTLRAWLLSDDRADYARAQMVAGHLTKALDDIEAADGPMPLARAREAFRAWSWIGERRIPKLFGQQLQQSIDLNVTLDLGDKLREARERIRTIESVADTPLIPPIESNPSE